MKLKILLVPGFGGSKLKFRTYTGSGDNKIYGPWKEIWVDLIKLYFKKFEEYLK